MAYHGSARLRGYSEEINFALDVGEGPTLRHARNRISTMALTPDEQYELAELDELVIDQILNFEDVQAYLLADDNSQPLTHWWWHLGRLRAGVYPAHLLPPHLQAIYQPAEQRHAA